MPGWKHEHLRGSKCLRSAAGKELIPSEGDLNRLQLVSVLGLE